MQSLGSVARCGKCRPRRDRSDHRAPRRGGAGRPRYRRAADATLCHLGELAEAALSRADSEGELSTADAARVHAGLARLSLVQRDVLTLFFLDDLSIDQIAEVMDIPAGTVKSR